MKILTPEELKARRAARDPRAKTTIKPPRPTGLWALVMRFVVGPPKRQRELNAMYSKNPVLSLTVTVVVTVGLYFICANFNNWVDHWFDPTVAQVEQRLEDPENCQKLFCPAKKADVIKAISFDVKNDSLTFGGTFRGKNNALCGSLSYTSMRGLPRFRRFVAEGRDVYFEGESLFGHYYRGACEN